MQTKIDCSIAENFLKERARMCESYGVHCNNCELHKEAAKHHLKCYQLFKKAPQKDVEIVQAWSDEHPIEPVVTYLDKLLEIFPSVKLNQKGVPRRFCPEALGLEELDCSLTATSDICKRCWSQPYKGE